MQVYHLRPGLPKLEERVKRDFPNLQTKIDKNLHIYAEAISELLSETKTISIRYVKNRICIPSAFWIPYFSINRETGRKKFSDIIEVPVIVIKPFSQLTLTDAVKDGLSSREELIRNLKEGHKKIESGELVSIYHLKKLI